jgi:hypothetical protein
MLPALLLHDTATVAAAIIISLLGAVVLATVVLASVLARTPSRRRDARATLTILLRHRRSG